jgi:hypothetical protein
MAVQPLIWMRAVRDHLPKPPANSSRLLVLVCLALRMHPGGTGFASQRQLADDATVSESTVRRHLRWGRETGYVEQTRRGHRIDENTVIASEYRLTQPVTGDLLAGDPTGQVDRPNRSSPGTQPVTGDRPRGLLPEVFPQPARAAAVDGHRGDPQADDGEGMESHQHEPNARRALTALVVERALPFDTDALLRDAYTVGKGDPWWGYLTIKTATEQSFAGARDPAAVLRKRLGLTVPRDPDTVARPNPVDVDLDELLARQEGMPP